MLWILIPPPEGFNDFHKTHGISKKMAIHIIDKESIGDDPNGEEIIMRESIINNSEANSNNNEIKRSVLLV